MGGALPRTIPERWLSRHARSRRCEIDRVSYQALLAEKRLRTVNVHSSPDEFSLFPEAAEVNLYIPGGESDDENTRAETEKERVVIDRLREMTTPRKVQLWFDQGVRGLPHPQLSDSHPPNLQTDDDVTEFLEEGEDEEAWEEKFFNEVCYRWAQIIDPPPDSTIPGLPASLATKVFELIEFVIDQLGAEKGIGGKDVFGTMGPSGSEKIVKEYLGKDAWWERYFTSSSGN